MIDHKALVEPLLATLGPSSNLRRYETSHCRPEYQGMARQYCISGQAQHLIEDVARYCSEAASEATVTDILTVATLVSRRLYPEG